jgi:hypothetical protein
MLAARSMRAAGERPAGSNRRAAEGVTPVIAQVPQTASRERLWRDRPLRPAPKGQRGRRARPPNSQAKGQRGKVGCDASRRGCRRTGRNAGSAVPLLDVLPAESPCPRPRCCTTRRRTRPGVGLPAALRGNRPLRLAPRRLSLPRRRRVQAFPPTGRRLQIVAPTRRRMQVVAPGRRHLQAAPPTRRRAQGAPPRRRCVQVAPPARRHL